MQVDFMPLIVETSLVIEQCRRELERFRQLAAEIRTANETNVLIGASKSEKPSNEVASPSPARLEQNPGGWRETANRTRAVAESVNEPIAKSRLLQIADSYDQLVS